MGTQQLQYIVLGIIAVGLGVIVGINIFGSSAEAANRDAITEDCIHIAAAAQGYFNKPSWLGGGNFTFNDIQISDCGMDPAGDPSTAENLNAVYVIEGSESTFTVTGTSKSEGGRTLTLVCDMSLPEGQQVSVSYESW